VGTIAHFRRGLRATFDAGGYHRGMSATVDEIRVRPGR
jgi:hypothetical protein